jgi:hypothetical protein
METLFNVEEFNQPIEQPKPFKAHHDKNGKFANKLIAKADREERRANGEAKRNSYLLSIISGMSKQLRWKDERILELESK